MTISKLYNDAIALLQQLIRTPSFSREESETADIIEKWLAEKSIDGAHRHGNNVWVRNLHFDPGKPTILLCSHHDTVRPSATWTRDPFDATIEEVSATNRSGEINRSGKANEAGTADAASWTDETGGARIYGLGSNDAGASVVSMAAAFRHFYERNYLTHNLILALVGEEEISGPGGVRSILPELGLGVNSENIRKTTPQHCPTYEKLSAMGWAAKNNPVEADCKKSGNVAEPDWSTTGDFAIVGEPTGMQLAIAERGLMVLDCTARGKAGHAARDEGDNAIYHAIRDIEWFRSFRFPRKSALFGDVKMSVTMIEAGTQHNVVPAECRFTVDCRVTEQYTNEEVLSIVCQHVMSDIKARSTHLRSSSISPSHPIVQAGKELRMNTFGSPTTSDQVAITNIPSVKIGPGQSSRSHSADEYVELAEIEQGISLYIKLLEKIIL